MKVRFLRSFTLALFCGGLLCSGGALAQMKSAQSPGFYAGGAIGQSTVSDGCGVVAAGVACDDTSMAWRILGGYQISRHFAVEAGYVHLADRDSGNAGGAARSKSYAWEVIGLGGNPLTENFGIYGKLGLFNAHTKMTSAAGTANESTSNFTFGFGARYDFSRPLAARIEWQRYKGVGGNTIGTTDVTVLSVGAIYKF